MTNIEMETLALMYCTTCGYIHETPDNIWDILDRNENQREGLQCPICLESTMHLCSYEEQAAYTVEGEIKAACLKYGEENIDARMTLFFVKDDNKEMFNCHFKELVKYMETRLMETSVCLFLDTRLVAIKGCIVPAWAFIDARHNLPHVLQAAYDYLDDSVIQIQEDWFTDPENPFDPVRDFIENIKQGNYPHYTEACSNVTTFGYFTDCYRSDFYNVEAENGTTICYFDAFKKLLILLNAYTKINELDDLQDFIAYCEMRLAMDTK